MTTTYDVMDRPVRATDALGGAALFEYNLDGNLTRSTDRRGTVSVFPHDALGRRTFAGSGASGGDTFASSVDYGWDAGGRLVSAVDSAGGRSRRPTMGLIS